MRRAHLSFQLSWARNPDLYSYKLIEYKPKYMEYEYQTWIQIYRI
jgi:hypothetical protein